MKNARALKWNWVVAGAILAVGMGNGRVFGELPGMGEAVAGANGGGAVENGAVNPPKGGTPSLVNGEGMEGGNLRPNGGNGSTMPPKGGTTNNVTPNLPRRGSLFKAAVEAPPAPGYVGGPEGARGGVVSLIAVVPPDPKRFRKNDLLTIVIREDSDSQVNGQTASKKTQDFDLALQQFIQAALSSSGIPTVATVGNSSSLPEIKFKFNNDRKADASQARSDSFSARLTATVVDVKPNNTMVIEAVKQITMDKEIQTFKLSGVCRGEDVAVDNTLLSTQLANLSVSKQTAGEVRDGTKRGWLNKIIDEVNPF